MSLPADVPRSEGVWCRVVVAVMGCPSGCCGVAHRSGCWLSWVSLFLQRAVLPVKGRSHATCSENHTMWLLDISYCSVGSWCSLRSLLNRPEHSKKPSFERARSPINREDHQDSA